MHKGDYRQLGPFIHTHETKLLHGRFTIGIADAYNARGLIGPEHNGIFILDEVHQRVVLDRHLGETTGYYGPGARQIGEFERICSLSVKDFVAFVNENKRTRIPIELEGIAA